jgi:hypothetical protein
MSTASRRTGSPTEPDQFRYGWRHVPVKNAKGRVTNYVEVPLTREDVLHPQEGDHIVNSDVHDDDRWYLKYVFRNRLSHDPHALVLSDCGVY